jgi:hypothetical protein
MLNQSQLELIVTEKTMPQSPYLKTVRLVGFTINLILFAITTFILGFVTVFFKSIEYFTFWTMLFIMIYYIKEIFWPSQNLHERSWNGFFSQMVLSFSFTITMSWFVALRCNIDEKHRNPILNQLHHTIPTLTIFVEYIFNNTILLYSNIPFFTIIVILYVPANYLLTTHVETIYPQIDYKDYMTAVWFSVLGFIYLTSSLFLVVFQKFMKPSLFAQQEKLNEVEIFEKEKQKNDIESGKEAETKKEGTEDKVES